MNDTNQKRSISKRTIFYWGLVFVGLTSIGLLNFSIIHTDALATERSGYDWREYLIYELTGACLTFPLIICLVQLWKKFPVHKNWLTRFPIYIAVTVATGAVHTSMMFLSRTVIFAIFFDRTYDYGYLPYRYVMEFHKQVVWIWMTFGAVFIIQHIRNHQQNKLQAERLQTQLANSRLDLMRQQINPHFLFNSLNLISSKVYEDPEVADQLISDLSDLLRESLDMSKTATTSLKSELGFLENYLSIMQSRFPDRIIVERVINSDCLDCEIPSLILQPIVENSFKHRLEIQQGEIQVKISCRRMEDSLEIRIEDAFIPASNTVLQLQKGNPKSGGTGLSNIRERLECLYGKHASMNSGPVDDLHYQTNIHIPLNSNA